MISKLTTSTLIFLSFHLSHCNKVKPSAMVNAAGTAKLCIAGGATLDPQANLCVCPEKMEWTGQKCESVHKSDAQLTESDGPGTPDDPGSQGTTTQITKGAVEAAAEGVEEASNASAHEAAPEVKGDEHHGDAHEIHENTVRKPTENWITAFQKRCVAAKGTFFTRDHYCICPDTKVLVDKTCRRLQGRMTDDVCLRAARPGKWVQGSCECAKDKIFSPSRGGCVFPIAYGRKYTGKSGLPPKTYLLIQKKACESSINKGLWNPETLDCQCGTGKVFYQELCLETQRLSSKEVCESFGQRGRWMRQQKTCQCPVGKLWVNQRCTPYPLISPEDGCHSNGSGGIWDSQTKTCLCPPGKIWAISGKSCRIASH